MRSPDDYSFVPVAGTVFAREHAGTYRMTAGSATIGSSEDVTLTAIVPELHPDDQVRTEPLASLECITMSTTLGAYAVATRLRRWLK